MLITDKALLILIIGTIFLLLTQLTMQSMANYVFPNYYGGLMADPSVATTAQSMTSLIGCVFMIIIAFFAPKLVLKFGKRELAFVSLFAGAAFFLITYIVHPTNVWVFVIFQILAYVCLGAFNSICFAMIIDVIDNAELRNGRRDDGKYYGVYSFARKLGQALSSLLSGALLTAIGYTAETAFDPVVTGKIFMLATLIPAIGFAISGVFLFIYPLKKKVVDANAVKLDEMHAAEKQNENQ
ncbi:MAG: MFS transporter [Clostridiales bacterium]|nr:MFS transporter [Clostridiales bacterium]